MLRREWSLAACCFANMDDIARYHYSDYNVWVRSPFGQPARSTAEALNGAPDYTFYHKIRLGTKACLEILISWCDGWMTNREHSLETGGPIVGHALLPLNIAGIVQVVKWLDADERYSPYLSSEVWISLEGCGPYKIVADEYCAKQNTKKAWYKANPNCIGWIFSTLPAWFVRFPPDEADITQYYQLPVNWLRAPDLNKHEMECPPNKNPSTWLEESERDSHCMGIKIKTKGEEEEDAREATQVRIRLKHGAYMIDDMDRATFEDWNNMAVCDLDWCRMNMFIGL